jgi:hypothetical protein
MSEAEAAVAKVTQAMIDVLPTEVFDATMAVMRENAALRAEVERLREQLRLANIDAINALAELANLPKEGGDDG